jgi:two-component system sensor histidine kinase VicK
MPINNKLNSYPFNFFAAPGEMSKLIREYDWENTSLGNPEQWPLSLVNSISLLLYSQFPMFLFWGENHVQFYNDAYRKTLGNSKLGLCLGENAEECWGENWPVIKKQLDKVLNTDESIWKDDQIVKMYKNDQLQDTYWTYSYSKVIDVDAGLGGVMVICYETTAKVNFERQTNETVKNLAESESRLRFMLEDAPIAIAVLAGKDLIIESANDKMLEMWGREKSVIGNKIEDTLPELIEQGFINILNDVFLEGDSFYGNEIKVLFGKAFNKEEFFTNFVFHPIKDTAKNTTHIMIIANVITEEVVARQKVEEAEEMLRLSIEAANVGTWVLDLNTGILSCSERLIELFGLNNKEIITLEKVYTKIPDKYLGKVKEHMDASINNGASYALEHPIYNDNANQHQKWIRALGKTHITDHTKKFSGIMIDITEQKIDDQRKNDFIGMVSHELKTPLTSLSAYLQLLFVKSQKNNDEFTTEILNKVNHQVRKMGQLINGFLNISRLESGKILLDKTQFDLIELIEDVRREFLITSSQNEIELIAHKPIIIFADYDKIVSVISNLLSNAIKYSPSTSPIIIKVKKEEKDIVVSVKDDGLGIKKSDLNNIFDRFYRSESNITKHISGFGIGLYLSAEIINRHNGKIWVESDEGQGSTFFFSIPITDK